MLNSSRVNPKKALIIVIKKILQDLQFYDPASPLFYFGLFISITSGMEHKINKLQNEFFSKARLYLIRENTLSLLDCTAPHGILISCDGGFGTRYLSLS